MPVPHQAPPSTPAEIFARVSLALQDTLGVDEQDVTLDARIPSDLGAESIDFNDIVFRMERLVQTKVTRNELFPKVVTDQNASDTLTDEILQEIQTHFPPGITLPTVQPGHSTVADLFTVRVLCQVVAQKLNVKWVDPS